MNEPSPADRYAVIGYPVHHSRSPLIHGMFARQTGQNVTYGLLEADVENFERAVSRFRAAGGRGLNVTVPHKEAAFRLAATLSREASEAGAVNTLTFEGTALRGDNTDGVGFLRDLTVNLGRSVEGRRVLILGAGGAARGIIPPLLRCMPLQLIVSNRTLTRAEELRQKFRL